MSQKTNPESEKCYWRCPDSSGDILKCRALEHIQYLFFIFTSNYPQIPESIYNRHAIDMAEKLAGLPGYCRNPEPCMEFITSRYREVFEVERPAPLDEMPKLRHNNPDQSPGEPQKTVKEICQMRMPMPWQIKTSASVLYSSRYIRPADSNPVSSWLKFIVQRLLRPKK